MCLLCRRTALVEGDGLPGRRVGYGHANLTVAAREIPLAATHRAVVKLCVLEREYLRVTNLQSVYQLGFVAGLVFSPALVGPAHDADFLPCASAHASTAALLNLRVLHPSLKLGMGFFLRVVHLTAVQTLISSIEQIPLVSRNTSSDRFLFSMLAFLK